MRSTRRGLRAVLVAVFTVGLLAGSAGPVLAHKVYAYHGSDQAWTNDGHDKLYVLDLECDGNTAYAEGYWYDPTIHGNRYVKLLELSGCGEPGRLYDAPGDFTLIRVCETSTACSAWKTIT